MSVTSEKSKAYGEQNVAKVVSPTVMGIGISTILPNSFQGDAASYAALFSTWSVASPMYETSKA